MRLGVVDHGDRRIFFHELVQRLAELDVVLAFLGGDRNREHRRTGRHRHQRFVRLLAGGDGVAGHGMVELGQRDGLADAGRAALLGGLAHELEHAGDTPGLALGRQERRAVGDLAVEHAHDRHLAAVRGLQRLHHIGERVAAGLDAEPLGGRRDVGRFVAQRLHQTQHAVGAGRRTHQHRTHEAVAQLLRQVVEDLVLRRLDVAEQLLHQLVVVVRQRLQHREARRLLAVDDVAFERHDFGSGVLLVDKGALQREVDETGDDVAVERRNLAQQKLRARRRLQQREHVVNGGVGLVDLVQEQEARNLLVLELAQDQLQLRDLLFVHLADDDGGVDTRQRRAHVMDELDRAGTIDEREAFAHEVRRRDRKLDAHVMMARFLAGVADRGSGVDGALALDRAGACEDCFEESGLAALERAYQRDAPGARGSCAVLCHFRLPR